MNFTFEVFEKTRGFFKLFLEQLSLEELNKIPTGYNNNIIWNIAHVIATEQVLIYKLSGVPMLVSDDFVNAYKKGSKPEADVTQADVNLISELLTETAKQTQINYSNNAYVTFPEYTPETTGTTIHNIDEALTFVLFHEGLHLGIVKSLLKSVKL